MNLSYELIIKNTLKLKEEAVSSISTAEDINDTIRVFVDYRVGICSFSVNKCNVAAPSCCERH